MPRISNSDLSDLVNDSEPSLRRDALSPWDAVCVVFGIVVGTSLFRAPPLVFSAASDPWIGMGLWALAGLLALCGALCFCELLTAYPLLGAEFVFLKRSFGRPVAFLYAWAQLGAILTGCIGAMAFVFVDYGGTLVPVIARYPVLAAAAVIVILSLVNLAGLTAGRLTQNLLSVVKLLGLGAILLAGAIAEAPGVSAGAGVPSAPPSAGGIGLALVFVLYSYGGWNDAALVAAEMRDLNRNVPRVLIAGLGAVIVLYLSINFAYLHGLGFSALCDSEAPAAELVRTAWGAGASSLVSLLVMISALGAIHGMLFTGVRLAAALGRDHPLLAPLGQWSARGVPSYGVILITVVALLQTLAVGTAAGQGLVDRFCRWLGLGDFPWQKFDGGFEALVAITSPTFWGFFLLTSLSLPILRLRDGDRPRPFRVPLYPFTPLVFTAMCGYMLYSSIAYAEHLSLVGVAMTALGALVYVIDRRINGRAHPRNESREP